MRILSYLNLSNPSNLDADSGYIFQRTLLKGIAHKHEVYLIGPSNMSGLDSSITAIYATFPETKYGVRFGFSYEDLKKTLSSLKPFDLLINNQTELTVPLQALCYEVWGRRIKCVSYFHYLAIQQFDAGNPVYDPSLDIEKFGAAIWDRQKEAFKYSDMNIIGSRFGRDLLRRALGSDFDEAKVCIIAPPVQPELGSLKNTERPSEKLSIVYNHRLYAHYGGLELFHMLTRLHEDYNFELIITDPTFQRSSARDKLDHSVQDIRKSLMALPFIKVIHYKSQEAYHQLLEGVDFGLGPMRTGALWSMAIVDVMSVGKPVIAFDNGAFSEVIQDEDLLFEDEASFRRIFIQLLTDSAYRRRKGEDALKTAVQYSTANITNKFEQVIQHIMIEK